MSIRTKFVEAFSESDAAAIEAAAQGHQSDWQTMDRKGSDPFKWALLMCISFECMGRFREDHGIQATSEALKDWVYNHADLGSHDGDADALGMLSGAYKGWVKEPESSKCESN